MFPLGSADEKRLWGEASPQGDGVRGRVRPGMHGVSLLHGTVPATGSEVSAANGRRRPPRRMEQEFRFVAVHFGQSSLRRS